MEADMTEKLKPNLGQQIVKIGGPVYRIGVGGGSASSVEVQGDNKVELDFNAVQRGMLYLYKSVFISAIEIQRLSKMSHHGEKKKKIVYKDILIMPINFVHFQMGF